MVVFYEFLNDCCVLQDIAGISVKQFYDAYINWWEKYEEKSESKRYISGRMARRGFKSFYVRLG
jgi:phage/plasmid-associated DNA primase